MKSNSALKIAVFADGEVGEKTVAFLLKNYPHHVGCIVLSSPESRIKTILAENDFDCRKMLYHNINLLEDIKRLLAEEPLDYIILAWWPYIIKEDMIKFPNKGVLNFHPSLLPYNRGKNYNFWTIVENTPFGVTIHFVDSGIDSGDIVFQKKIEKNWEDTGRTLYEKASQAMYDLFEESYPLLVQGKYIRVKQDLTKGSLHYAKELNPSSCIDLGKHYKASDLLNLLRARTFPPHPACYFESDGEEYEVRIEIRKRERTHGATK